MSDLMEFNDKIKIALSCTIEAVKQDLILKQGIFNINRSKLRFIKINLSIIIIFFKNYKTY
jgi:hypothetical protein